MFLLKDEKWDPKRDEAHIFFSKSKVEPQGGSRVFFENIIQTLEPHNFLKAPHLTLEPHI